MAKSKVNIQPLSDRVVIKAAEAETKTKSGIIIPDSAKEKPQKGEVVAVGPNVSLNTDLYHAFLAAYQQVRPLTDDEQEVLPNLVVFHFSFYRPHYAGNQY